MASIKHTHTYVYWEKRNGHDYYKCDDPHCTHYAKRSMVIGKASVCSKCKTREIILNWKILKNKRPLCLECGGNKEAREFQTTKEIMAAILGGEKKAS